MRAKEMLRVWDELRFGLLVHRAVADTTGAGHDLTRSFKDRVEAASKALSAALPNDTETAAIHQTMLADILRRKAVLSAYLGDHTESVDDFMGAGAAYARVDPTGDAPMVDELSAVSMAVEVSVVSRATRNSELVKRFDMNAEGLRRSGLVHFVDIVESEKVANELFHVEVDGSLSVVDRDRASGRERAYLELVDSLCHMHNGNESDAAAMVDRALENLGNGFYGASRSEKTDRHFDQVVANLIAGHSLIGRDRVHRLNETVELVEQIRGGWRLGASRSDPLWEPLEVILQAALTGVAAVPSGAWQAVRIAEAMRRRQVAGMLRTTRFISTLDSSRSLPSAESSLVALSDLKILHEDDAVHLAGDAPAASMEGSVSSPVVEFDPNGRLPTADEPVADPRDTARQDVATAVSDFFADSFLPEVVTVDSIREAVAGRHVLQFTYLSDGRLVRIWISPDETVVVDVLTDSPAAVELDAIDFVGASDEWKRRFYFSHYRPGDGPAGVEPSQSLALSVAETLLPAGLREELLLAEGPKDLLIVPDGRLGNVAWPGLFVDEQTHLVQVANPILVPSLSLLEHGGEGVWRARDVLAGLVEYEVGGPDEPLNLNDLRNFLVVADEAPTTSLSAWIELLLKLPADQRANALALVCAHGYEGDVGLDELGTQLVDGDGYVWSSLELMSLPWPRLVAFIGCFTARSGLEVASGLAPLGIAVAAMANGAQTVLGGTDKVLDRPTGGLCTQWASLGGRQPGLLARLQSTKGHPAQALAEAQRAWLADHAGGDFAAPIAWARFGVFTRAVPRLGDTAAES